MAEPSEKGVELARASFRVFARFVRWEISGDPEDDRQQDAVGHDHGGEQPRRHPHQITAGDVHAEVDGPPEQREHAESSQNPPPPGHHDTSIRDTHLVSSNSGRFGATNRSG